MLDEIVRRSPDLGLDRRAEKFVELFESRLEKCSRILDIGGRWGFYDAPLSACGHTVTVLDVVRPTYQKTPVVIYDGGRFPFPDKSFDASLLVTVLHHIRNPEPVLREARRVTRGNLIVIEDLYHHWLGRQWTILRDRIYNFEFFGHPCGFRKAEEWVALIEQSGFEFVEKKEVYTVLAGMRILNGVLVFRVRT